ncbi:hypothetical protein GF345_00665 [Candidatus Woesearchaeota archaeon]|nr:hypothetical protein [Candidatus Woesearchaeota archaeon]
MNPYIVVMIVLFAMAGIGLGAYYYLIRSKKAGSIEHDYLWVGPGEHPFKGKEEEKE